VITKHPCEYISRIEEGIVDIEPFSFDELRHLLDTLREKDLEWHDLFLFWSRTGLRPGELYALKWEHVDMFNGQVSIRANLDRKGNDGPVKTRNSNRTISLRPVVIEALKRQKARTGLMNGHIFLNPQSKQWNQTNFTKAFRYRLRLADIKIRPPKQMRHTFATLHIGAGESISWVSKMLGHSDVQITLKRYNRFIPNLTRDDGSAFENVINGNNPGMKGLKAL
jgi:integrase